MRYVRYHHSGEDRWGVLVGEDVIQPLDNRPYMGGRPRGTPLPLNAVKLLAPCEPTKIVAIGKNYQAHINEMEYVGPPKPTLFLMPSTALLHPDSTLVLPPKSLTKQVDYEGELALVISKKAAHIKPEDISEYVLGFTCFNDVTARDLQIEDGQWTRAKGLDGFAPVGPLVTDEVDPNNLRIRTRLNGKIVQDANTRDMIMPVADLVAFISEYITLLPGDVVVTGTPSGVGPMKGGDKVEISIEGIGLLRTFIEEREEA